MVTAGAGVPEVEQHEPVHDHVFGVRCRPECPRWMNPVPQPDWEPAQDWFFTFGWDHSHPVTGAPLRKSYVRIHGTCDSTREEMNAAFGNRWSFQYSLAEKPSKIDRYDLAEVPMPGQEPPVDDDEALREVYAQDEADQDRVPTAAGFDAWKGLRRAVGQGNPPNTPAEARTGISDVQAAVLDEVDKLRRHILVWMPNPDGRRGALARLDRIASWVGGEQR